MEGKNTPGRLISGTVPVNLGRMVTVIQREICYKIYSNGGDLETAPFSVLPPHIQHVLMNLLRWQRH